MPDHSRTKRRVVLLVMALVVLGAGGLPALEFGTGCMSEILEANPEPLDPGIWHTGGGSMPTYAMECGGGAPYTCEFIDSTMTATTNQDEYHYAPEPGTMYNHDHRIQSGGSCGGGSE